MELSKRQVSDCRRQMLRHTGDLSLVAAGTVNSVSSRIHDAPAPPLRHADSIIVLQLSHHMQKQSS